MVRYETVQIFLFIMRPHPKYMDNSSIYLTILFFFILTDIYSDAGY